MLAAVILKGLNHRASSLRPNWYTLATSSLCYKHSVMEQQLLTLL
jgi:hypothetical protein